MDERTHEFMVQVCMNLWFNSMQLFPKYRMKNTLNNPKLGNTVM